MRIQAIGKEYTMWLQGEKVMTYKSDKHPGPHRHSTARQPQHGDDFRKLGILQLK